MELIETHNFELELNQGKGDLGNVRKISGPYSCMYNPGFPAGKIRQGEPKEQTGAVKQTQLCT